MKKSSADYIEQNKSCRYFVTTFACAIEMKLETHVKQIAILKELK